MCFAHKVAKRERDADGRFREYPIDPVFASANEAIRFAERFADEERARGTSRAYIDARFALSYKQATLRYTQRSFACDPQEPRESTARALPIGPPLGRS